MNWNLFVSWKLHAHRSPCLDLTVNRFAVHLYLLQPRIVRCCDSYSMFRSFGPSSGQLLLLITSAFAPLSPSDMYDMITIFEFSSASSLSSSISFFEKINLNIIIWMLKKLSLNRVAVARWWTWSVNGNGMSMSLLSPTCTAVQPQNKYLSICYT